MNLATISKLRKLQIIYKSYEKSELSLTWLGDEKGKFNSIEFNNVLISFIGMCDSL
jgi:hypothetical protein